MKHKSRQPHERRTTKSLQQLVPKESKELLSVVERNMEAIETHRREAECQRSYEERIADGITYFTGSMPFVYFHIVFFAVWIAANVNLLGLPAFDRSLNSSAAPFSTARATGHSRRSPALICGAAMASARRYSSSTSRLMKGRCSLISTPTSAPADGHARRVVKTTCFSCGTSCSGKT